MATHKLNFPAPVRDWQWTGEGWSGQKWTERAVNEAKRGGAWFRKSYHDFADKKAADAAGVADV